MSFFTSNGDVLSPGLIKRNRVYADLDYETRLTKQEFIQEMDLNRIMSRYKEKGILPDLIRHDPTYADFSNVTDFQSSLNVVTKAQEQFEALSADVRNRFANDPAQFLEFVHDPKNFPELVKMGLATQPLPTPRSELSELTEALKERNRLDSEGSPTPLKGKSTK